MSARDPMFGPPLGLPEQFQMREPRNKLLWAEAEIEERMLWHQQMFIPYSTVSELLADAWDKQQEAHIDSKPAVMLIEGETGSGKTTFADELARHINAAFSKFDPERKIVPVLHITTPDPCTPKELCIQILNSLGDLQPRRRERAELTAQTLTMLLGCRVRVIIFDNVQDIPVKRASRGIEQVLTRLRELIDGSNCLWVLLGTKEARAVIRSEAQIMRRVPYEKSLEYFSISKKPKARVFAEVLCRIDDWLPLPERTDLKTFAPFIHIATEGIFSRMVDLLGAAAIKAAKNQSSRISRSELAAAFEYLYGRGRGINPFEEDFKPRRLSGQNEPYEFLRAP